MRRYDVAELDAGLALELAEDFVTLVGDKNAIRTLDLQDTRTLERFLDRQRVMPTEINCEIVVGWLATLLA